MSDRLVLLNSTRDLSRWTSARLGQGRVGSSSPTAAVLDFNMDHARARDAIYTPLPEAELTQQLKDRGLPVESVRSRARDRAEYLRRPDLGRSLAPESLSTLEQNHIPSDGLLTIVIADGLSSLAPATHAVPLIDLLRPALSGWALDTIFIATQARVAIADEIAQARGAAASIILIGERPGLKSFDSLGAYLTYRPEIGCTDADRNCVSNIRPAGLSYEQAAFKLIHLLNGARAQRRSGVHLKDQSDRIEETAALPARSSEPEN